MTKKRWIRVSLVLPFCIFAVLKLEYLEWIPVGISLNLMLMLIDWKLPKYRISNNYIRPTIRQWAPLVVMLLLYVVLKIYS